MSDAIEDFLEEKEKQAGFWTDIGKGFMGGGGASAGHNVGRMLMGGAISAGAGAGVTGAYKGFRALMERRDSPRDYQAMIAAHPVLRKKPARQVQMLYNSLRTTAPDMAKDPLIAGSFVRNMMAIQPDEGLAVPMETVKTLADTQKGISQARSADEAPRFLSGLISPTIKMSREK